MMSQLASSFQEIKYHLNRFIYLFWDLFTELMLLVSLKEKGPFYMYKIIFFFCEFFCLFVDTLTL